MKLNKIITYSIFILFLLLLTLFNKKQKIIYGQGLQDQNVVHALRENRIDLEDLEIPEDVRIIGLGEHSHGSKIDQDLKVEIYKLAFENGFYLILAETDYASGKRIDKYIKSNSRERARDVVSSLVSPSYRSKEFINFIDTLKKINLKNNNKISFVGYDVQYFEINIRYLLEKMENILDENTIKRINYLKAKKDYSNLINEMKYINRNNTTDKELNYLIENTINSIDLVMETDPAKYFMIREKFNSENIKKLSNGKKVFLISHNGHIMKDYFDNIDMPTLGKILDKENSYFAILVFPYEDELRINKIVNNFLSYYKVLKIINNNNKLLFNHKFLGKDISVYEFDKINDLSVFSKVYKYFFIGDGYSNEEDLKYFYYTKDITISSDILIIINKEKSLDRIYPYDKDFLLK